MLDRYIERIQYCKRINELVRSNYKYISSYIQKYTLDYELVWERVIIDPVEYVRIGVALDIERGGKLYLPGNVFPNIGGGNGSDAFLMVMDTSGCYQGDCSDTIYLNGMLSSVQEGEPLEGQVWSTVYPNPSSGWVNVSAPVGSEVVVVSMMGAETHRYRQERSVERIEITGSGVYMIHIRHDGLHATHRVVVHGGG